MTLASHHTFRSLNELRQAMRKVGGVALLPWCCMNSGWMLLIPGTLLGFRCLIADNIPS